MIRHNVVKVRLSNGQFRQLNLNSTVNRHKNSNVYRACSKITYMFFLINDQDVCCSSLSNFRPTFFKCFLVCLDFNLQPYDDKSTKIRNLWNFELSHSHTIYSLWLRLWLFLLCPLTQSCFSNLAYKQNYLVTRK